MIGVDKRAVRRAIAAAGLAAAAIIGATLTLIVLWWRR